MEAQIIEKLKQMGKITDEDISEALKMIPSKFEVDLVHNIWDAYSDAPISNFDEEFNIWISHFLPILRNESFKCMEKVRELNESTETMPSIE
jgi:hypothetical protein